MHYYATIGEDIYKLFFILLESIYDVKIKDICYYINHKHTHTK